MNNPNPVEKLINAIGALSEVCAEMMNRLMQNGFTREEALYLTGEFIKSAFDNLSGK